MPTFSKDFNNVNEKVNFFPSMVDWDENMQKAVVLLHYYRYGNMGYGKFKGGTKNQKGFVPNMAIFQEKIHIFKNG